MNELQLKQLDEQAAHYLTELLNDNYFIHDKEAYSLFKTILERFYRNSKDCFEKIGLSVIEEDCYYEGYDSKGRLQRASFWLPLDLLSCSTLYEAFYLSCSFLSPESAASRLMRRIDQEVRREGYSVDKLYGFFKILYRVLDESDYNFYKNIITGDIFARDKFRAFFSGRIDENDLSADDLKAGVVAFSKSSLKFQTKGIVSLRNVLLSEETQCMSLKLGHVTGVDFSDGTAVAELITNITINIELEDHRFSDRFLHPLSNFIVSLSIETTFHDAMLSFYVRDIKSLKIKTEINRMNGHICEHTLTYSLPRLKLTDFKTNSYKKIYS